MTRITEDEFLNSNGPKSGRVQSIQFPATFFVRGDKPRSWVVEGSILRTESNTFQNFGALLYEYPHGGLRDAPKKTPYEKAVEYFDKHVQRPIDVLYQEFGAEEHAAVIIEKVLADR